MMSLHVRELAHKVWLCHTVVQDSIKVKCYIVCREVEQYPQHTPRLEKLVCYPL